MLSFILSKKALLCCFQFHCNIEERAGVSAAVAAGGGHMPGVGFDCSPLEVYETGGSV